MEGDRLSRQRLTNLRATLGFLTLPPTEPELVALHATFDSWSGLGLIAVGLARQGYRLSLSHIGPGECTALTTTRRFPRAGRCGRHAPGPDPSSSNR